MCHRIFECGLLTGTWSAEGIMASGHVKPRKTGRLENTIAESARGISPRAAHRSGLDTLASSGSCHRMKAAAFR